MMIIRKHSVILLILLAALVLAACGGGEEEKSPPAVQLRVGAQVYEEAAFSYCWPQSADNWDCDVNSAAGVQPGQQISVTEGDVVNITIPETAGTINSITAKVLNAPGNVQNLGQGPEGVFDAKLADGNYSVQVDVVYSSVEGVELPPDSEPYVSYVFGLQIAGMVLPTPTVTPTATPTDTATPTATYTPTLTPTNTATFTPTLTPTNTATYTPTLTPTNTLTSTPQPTNTATPTVEPTVTTVAAVSTKEPVTTTATTVPPRPSATAVAAVSNTPLGEVELSGSVRLASGQTTMAVAGALVSLSYSSTQANVSPVSASTTTDANGRFTLDALNVFATDQIVISAAAPNYIAQSIQLSGTDAATGTAIEFVLQPAAATAPTPTPQPTDQSLPAGMPQVPRLGLTIAGREYGPSGYEICERATSGEQICVSRPAESESRRVDLLRGSSIQIGIEGTRPQEVSIEYLSAVGTPTGQPEVRLGDNRLLLVVTPEPGSYIMVINVKWPENEATYFFQVTVSN